MRDYEFRILNQPVDVSKDFAKLENVYFNGTRMVDFDPSSGFEHIVPAPWRGSKKSEFRPFCSAGRIDK